MVCAACCLVTARAAADIRTGQLEPGRYHGVLAAPVFVETPGTVRDSRGTARHDIRYVLRAKGLDVFFRDDGISYVFRRNHGTVLPGVSGAGRGREDLVSYYRIDLSFIGASRHGRLEPSDVETSAVHRYSVAGPSRIVHAYGRLTYHDVYPGIDLVFTARDEGVKYDLVARPGADTRAVRFGYDGLDSVRLRPDGALELRSPLGTIVEEAPVAWTTAVAAPDPRCAAGEHVSTDFVVEGNTVSFAPAAYDPSHVLVIDPGIVWSTFYGGSGEDWAYGVAIDAQQNIFVTGRTASIDFPVAAGYQPASAGNFDAFLVKLDGAGQRIWATYFGGSDLDYAYDVAVDAAGRPSIVGWTRSDDLPVASAAQPARGGDFDAFTASFTPEGALRWSTYAGGTLEERGLSITCDAGHNVVIAGSTFSSDFPVLNAQQPNNAGFSDAFLVKYDTLGARRWARYLGGSAAEEAWGVAASQAGIAVAGRTASTDFPAASAQQPLFGGASDAFVAVLDTAGARLWATYQGGDEEDAAQAVAIDAAGRVLVAGTTESDNFPVLNALQSDRALLGDAFVALYSNGGALQWSTFYGGNSSDIAIAAAFDAAGNALVAGSTGSTTLPVRNAPMLKHPGDEAFVARFSSAGLLQFASYVGGQANEGAAGVAAAGAAVVLCGTTNSTDFPTLNPQQAAHQGGPWDAFVLKIEECSVPATVTALGPTRFCPGSSVVLEANDGAGLTYEWHNENGKISGATDRQYTVSDSGWYSVLVKDAAGCYSSSPPVRVSLSTLETRTRPDTIICRGGSVPLWVTPVGGIAPFTYRWSPAATLTVTDAAQTRATPDTTTRYTVVVTDSIGCVDTAQISIVVRHAEVDAGPSVFVCRGIGARLSAAVLEGIPPIRYRWLPSDGLDLSDGPNPTAAPDSTTTYTVTITDALGCAAVDTVTVRVSTLRAEARGGGTICPGAGIGLTAFADGGTPPYTYQWSPDAGLSNATVASPVARPTVTTLYTVTVRDGVGCVRTSPVTVFVLPAASVSIRSSGRRVICEGDSLVLTASELFPFYRWSTGANARSITVRASGMYSLLVRDAQGCEARDSIEITQYPLPTPVITALRPLIFCPGDSTVLDAGAGYTSVRWSTGDTTRLLVVKRAGLYDVTVYNDGGCAGTARPVAVSVHAVRAASFEGPASACPYSFSRYTAPLYPKYSYRWTVTGGTPFSGAATDTLLVRWGAPGTARVVLTMIDDSTGCVDTAAADVAVAPVLRPGIVPSGDVTLCENDSVTLDAGAGYATYEWLLPGGGTVAARTLTIAAPGRYILHVSDAGGCEGRDTARLILRAHPVPVVQAEPGPFFCEGDSVSLAVKGAYVSYRWSTGDTSAAIVLWAEGLYTVTVVDSAGCTGSSEPLLIRAAAPPAVSVMGPSVLCSGAEGLYRALVPRNVTAAWSVAGADSVKRDGDSIRVFWSAPGAHIVSLLGRDDSTGCASTFDLQVNVLPSPRPIIVRDGSTTLCEGDSVVLRADAVYRGYRWSTGADTPSIVVWDPGVYSLTVTDGAGCEGTSPPVSVDVVVRPRPVPEGPATVCRGSVAVYGVSVQPGDSVFWEIRGGTPRSPLLDTAVAVEWSAAGTGTVRVTVRRGAIRCEGSAVLEVSVGDSLTPVIRVIGTRDFCDGDSVLLDAGPGFATYEWLEGAALLGSNRFLTLRRDAVVRVRVRDAAGCGGESAPVTLRRFAAPRPVIAGPRVFCAGDSITLDAGVNAVAYTWRDAAGSAVSAARVCVVSAPGVYTVTVTDSNGCTGVSPGHAVLLLPVPPKPVITRSGDSLVSSVAAGYAWSRDGADLTGETDRILRITRNGRYVVTVSNADGCSARSDPFDVQDGVRATAALSLPGIVARPGDLVRLPLDLVSSSGLQAAGATRLRGILRFDASVLAPAGGTPEGIVVGRERRVPVDAALASDRGIVAEYLFVATLGDRDSSLLVLDSLSFAGAAVDARLDTGMIRITICREGGARLFDGAAALSLRQVGPNPFNASTVLEIDIIEAGRSRLSVYDALGREMAVLADAELPRGSHRFVLDAGALPSGLYFCVLHTPATAVYLPLMLAK